MMVPAPIKLCPASRARAQALRALFDAVNMRLRVAGPSSGVAVAPAAAPSPAGDAPGDGAGPSSVVPLPVGLSSDCAPDLGSDAAVWPFGGGADCGAPAAGGVSAAGFVFSVSGFFAITGRGLRAGTHLGTVITDSPPERKLDLGRPVPPVL